MKSLTKKFEFKSLAGDQVHQVFTHFSGNMVFMFISMFLVLGMASCSKEDISFEPDQAIVLSGPGGDPSKLLDAQHTYENAQTSDPVLTDLEFATRVVFDVLDPVEGEGQVYILNTQSAGTSDEYGEFEIAISLRVNGETGHTTGNIVYVFPDSQSSLQFRIEGYFSDWEFAEYSELEVTIVDGTGDFEGATGMGNVFFLGNIFHDMQRKDYVETYTSTSFLLQLL
jgi:hypothetical protein